MNDQPYPNPPKRKMPRVLRRFLLVLAWFITAVALFFGEENWRGRRAWNNYQDKLKSEGAILDLAAFIPKPVPDEQNFASTPFVKSWFPKAKGGWGDEFDHISGRVPSPSDGKRHLTDFEAWKMAYDGVLPKEIKEKVKARVGHLDSAARAKAAQEVLEEFKMTEPIFDELREASRRPFVVYPVDYRLDDPWGILLPHLAKIKGACQRLATKACAELALGQIDKAFEDLKLLFFMTDSIKEEPFLISYLVRIACLQIASQPVWEALTQHRWSPAQLEQVQSWFEKADPLQELT
ncbi:MAG TPA: hypothetical protein VGE41_04870, partial [Verrucomicrobiae bacterium]